MKIAVISDIHGNDVALKVVLREAKRINVEHLFVLGDLVGYYYHSDKVIKLLDPWSKDMIKGNHEEMLAKLINKKIDPNIIKKKFGSGLQFAYERLSKSEIDKLIQLPYSKEVYYKGLRFLLCHGTPWDPDYYLYPDANIRIFDRIKQLNTDYVFLGHTHYSYVAHTDNKLIVNVGSVGQSREKGSIAYWAILNTENRVLTVKATPYNSKDIIDEVKRNDPEISYLHQVLVRNRD